MNEPRFNEGLIFSSEGLRYSNGRLEPRQMALAGEVPFTLFVNDLEVLSIAALPSNLDLLFVGFLVSEGVLVSPDEVRGCLVDPANKLVALDVEVPEERLARLGRKGMLTSGCAGGMVFSVEYEGQGPKAGGEKLVVPCSSILKRMYEVDAYTGIYRITKGVHAAAVCTPQSTLLILEDLGRHNAVDKIVGHCFLNRIETADKLLLTTGRITSEVLVKASRSGFPIVVSRSSASSLALHLARQSSIDLVTYVRAGKFNYFGHGGVRLVED
jgi:FdhD protein